MAGLLKAISRYIFATILSFFVAANGYAKSGQGISFVSPGQVIKEPAK